MIVQQFGELRETDDIIEFMFDSPKKLKYCVISEDITKSQRVEKFDLYLLRANGKYKRAYSGTVIGMKKNYSAERQRYRRHADYPPIALYTVYQ